VIATAVTYTNACYPCYSISYFHSDAFVFALCSVEIRYNHHKYVDECVAFMRSLEIIKPLPGGFYSYYPFIPTPAPSYSVRTPAGAALPHGTVVPTR
jgi:hypothetical protein